MKFTTKCSFCRNPYHKKMLLPVIVEADILAIALTFCCTLPLKKSLTCEGKNFCFKQRREVEMVLSQNLSS